MDWLKINKNFVIMAAFVILLGASIFFRNRISSLFDFSLDKKEPDLSLNVSSTSISVPQKSIIYDANNPILEKKKETFPTYTGRDPGEVRPTPEDIKIFSEEQKSKLFSLIMTYAERVKKSPNDFDGWIQIGILKKTIGDFEGARDAWEYVGVIAPLNSISFSNLGELYWRYLHDYPKSEINFKTSIKNRPDDTSTYISLSGLYFYSYEEKKDLADDILFDGLKANPDDNNLMKALAALYERQKDYSRSLEWWKKVLEKEPNNKEVAQTIEDLNKKIGQPTP